MSTVANLKLGQPRPEQNFATVVDCLVGSIPAMDAIDAEARVSQICEIEDVTGQQLPEAIVRPAAEKLRVACQRFSANQFFASDAAIAVRLQKSSALAEALLARYASV